MRAFRSPKMESSNGGHPLQQRRSPFPKKNLDRGLLMETL